MSDHAVLAPSAAKRWLNCPGSRTVCAGLESEDSAPAREGSFAHDIAQRCLDEGKRAEDLIGVTSECGDFVWDHTLADALQIYIDAVNDITFMADVALIEQKVVVDPEQNWGTSDVVAWDEETLDIIDLKFGWFYVSAKMNEQMMNYAVAALMSLDDLPSTLKTVRMTIVQPRHFNEDDLVRTAVMTIGEIRQWADRVLMPGIEKTNDPKARLVPGDYCTFCPGRLGKCIAFQSEALAVAEEVFPEGDLDEKPATPPLPDLLSPTRLKAVLDNADMLRDWLKACEKHAKTQMQAGLEIPGYKVVNSVGNRKWKDEKKVRAALKNVGVNPIAERTISPAQAKQALTDGTGKEKQEFIDQFCDRPITGATLVSDDDPRPALTNASVFPEEK